MKLKVQSMDISTGGTLVAVLHELDAAKYDLHREDRVGLRHRGKHITAVLDITHTKKVVKPGNVGLFLESQKALGVTGGSPVSLHLEDKPRSLYYIRRKLNGHKLKPEDLRMIIQDIVDKKLTHIELTYFVAGTFTHGMDLDETVALTKAMINTGEVLHLNKKPIIDKHCIGGVAGNRTTMVVVPMLVAAGLTVPKTSSRAITSPAGTADTMEVLAGVTHQMKEIKQIVMKTGGCMVWGGGVNLAPADDDIINVEYPLSIDAESQLLASVLAKKGSVNATHVQIDIPVGKGSKMESLKDARHLERMFKKVGKKLGMHIHVVITDGSQPIGNGIGPALEARDVLWLLKNDSRAPQDLKEKSIKLASAIMKYAAPKCPKPIEKYMREIIDSGAAYTKMVEMIKAQGAKITDPEKIKIGAFTMDYTAKKSGKIRHISSKTISKIARVAGCPRDHGAGIFLHHHVGDKVKKGDALYTVYAENKEKLKHTATFMKMLDGIEIK